MNPFNTLAGAVLAAVSIIALAAACSRDPVISNVNAPLVSAMAAPTSAQPAPVDFLYKDVCLGQPGKETIHRAFYHVGADAPFSVIQLSYGGYGSPDYCDPAAP